MGDDNRTEILFDRLMLIELRGIMSKLDPKAYAELRSYHEPPKVGTPRPAQGQYTTSRPRSVHHEPPKVSTPQAAQGQYTMSRPRSVHHDLPKVSTPRAIQGQYTTTCPRSVHHDPPKVSTP